MTQHIEAADQTTHLFIIMIVLYTHLIRQTICHEDHKLNLNK